MYVSVIATVFNEEKNIERLLDSLANQTRRPDEVVLCDGGSQDSTTKIIAHYAQKNRERLPHLKLLVEPGANISRGRNLAIAAAQGDVIAVTDAGVRLDGRWLEYLVAGFAEEKMEGGGWKAETVQADPTPVEATDRHSLVAGVAGFFLPDVEGAFQTAMAATVLPLQADIDPNKFLPSSRSVAFRKAAWQQIGGYPEWLDYCEDLIFDLKMNDLKRAGEQSQRESGWAWAPNALVYFRPRESFRSFWTQYYRYARGDGKADLWLKRHFVRYATYLVGFPLLLGLIFAGSWLRWLGWLGLLVGVLYYCWRPWQRLQKLGTSLSGGQWLHAALLVPLIRAVGDIAKMVGYPVGLWWRWKNRSWQEIWWR